VSAGVVGACAVGVLVGAGSATGPDDGGAEAGSVSAGTRRPLPQAALPKAAADRRRRLSDRPDIGPSGRV
jgi:hypothetical protein